ncbi:hypothetical protein [Phaeobacter sp. HF9A]|uniref:hypothetical protein n=1 Tax=Phaeobacter sp. HF9A TaxID=2721561 RepID=UPI001431880B|nr:hypothetical protein [Phaeobacter sp. HF9A]NIZ13228.1 hypothetical protein [Phaeobacter sp. HF9A]
MLNDIYARSMLTATRHCDVPQRPLPSAYRKPRQRPSLLRQLLRHLAAASAKGKISLAEGPKLQHPVNCK